MMLRVTATKTTGLRMRGSDFISTTFLDRKRDSRSERWRSSFGRRLGSWSSSPHRDFETAASSFNRYSLQTATVLFPIPCRCSSHLN